MPTPLWTPLDDGQALEALSQPRVPSLMNYSPCALLPLAMAVGVGFSYSTDPQKDYIMGDSQVTPPTHNNAHLPPTHSNAHQPPRRPVLHRAASWEDIQPRSSPRFDASCPLQTAADNYELLQKFLERYPHLRTNDLHLASESYGGKPPTRLNQDTTP